MPEKFRQKSLEEIREEEIEAKIKERGKEGEILGGIVFEKEIDPETKEEKNFLYIGNPYEERPTVVKLETEATEKDIKAVKKEIIPMKESFEILEAMAKTYKQREPLLIEGPTAIGKTYLAEKFTEMLYGKETKPLDFYCSGQTDVSELMAKWVPKVETDEEKKKWEKFLELGETQIKLSQIAQEVEQKTALSQEQKLSLVHIRLQKLAEEAGLSEKTQWRFQYGAVPKAMGLTKNPDGTFSFNEKNGGGFILHIEEVGLAEPQVINALLKVRGKSGKLADEIQLWENGGRKVKAGPKFWVVFSTNPPEEYLARNEIDPALARGVVFKRMGDLSEESVYLAADYYFTYKFGEKPEEKPEGCILDIYDHPEIGKEIAKVMAAFHNDLNKEQKKGEKGRQQRIPLTLDDMARVARSLIYFQIRDKKTGHVDISETIKKSVVFYYLDRLADLDLRERMIKNLDDILFNTTGATGEIEFEGKKMSRKQMFDILVERASISGEKREEIRERKQREEERKLRQAKIAIEDATDSLGGNPNVPDSIKDILKDILNE